MTAFLIWWLTILTLVMIGVIYSLVTHLQEHNKPDPADEAEEDVWEITREAFEQMVEHVRKRLQ